MASSSASYQHKWGRGECRLKLYLSSKPSADEPTEQPDRKVFLEFRLTHRVRWEMPAPGGGIYQLRDVLSGPTEVRRVPEKPSSFSRPGVAAAVVSQVTETVLGSLPRQAFWFLRDKIWRFMEDRLQGFEGVVIAVEMWSVRDFDEYQGSCGAPTGVIHGVALRSAGGDDRGTCALCRADMKTGLTLLPCKHAFHGTCIARCSRVKKSCPVCRPEIN